MSDRAQVSGFLTLFMYQFHQLTGAFPNDAIRGLKPIAVQPIVHGPLDVGLSVRLQVAHVELRRDLGAEVIPEFRRTPSAPIGLEGLRQGDIGNSVFRERRNWTFAHDGRSSLGLLGEIATAEHGYNVVTEELNAVGSTVYLAAAKANFEISGYPVLFACSERARPPEEIRNGIIVQIRARARMSFL
jgi:hypothetical protein